MTGRILGLDPGERRIGVALSDPTGTIASPHSVIDRQRQDLAAVVAEICRDADVHEVVVGLPIGLDGGEGRAATLARGVAAEVAAATGLPVSMYDERFSSKTAEAALLEGDVARRERRVVRDKVAAAVLLQGYLDATRNDGQQDDVRDGGAPAV